MVDCIWRGNNRLGESPIWDPRDEVIYWVDILAKQLHQLHPKSRLHQYWTLDESPCCLGLHQNGHLVGALASRFVSIELPSSHVDTLTAPIDPTQVMFNDGHCDPFGHFWAGTKDLEEKASKASIYAMDQKHEITVHDNDYIVANGLEWAPDDTTLYIADSPKGAIYQYQYNSTDKTLSSKTLFNQSHELKGFPDGLAIDTSGFLWNARFGGGCIVRFSPKGTVDQVIDLPVTYPTSCCFGGKDMKTLFITTATRDLTEAQQIQEPLAGSLLAMEAPVEGQPPRYYID